MNYYNKKYKLFCICDAILIKFIRDKDELCCDFCDNLIPLGDQFLGCTQGIFFFLKFI